MPETADGTKPSTCYVFTYTNGWAMYTGWTCQTKGRFTSPGWTGAGWWEISSHYSNGMQFKTYELFISGISHLIFLDHSWPQVTETVESETMGEWGFYLENQEKSLNYSLGKCKIKPQWDTTLHPPGWLKIKKIVTNIGKDVEKHEPSGMAGRNIKWQIQPFQKTIWQFL